MITEIPLPTIGRSIGDHAPPVFRGAPRKTGGRAKLGKIQTALLGSFHPASTADLDVMVVAIVDELAPDLVVRNSIGHNSAAQLLLTAGDNPDRLRSEASFAALCGVNPVPASSGKTMRHRLNRGGDRHANSALHIIAIGRLRTDQRTKDYVAKRVAEGHSKLEAIRVLKRYIAREVFAVITRRQKQINTGGIAA